MLVVFDSTRRTRGFLSSPRRRVRPVPFDGVSSERGRVGGCSRSGASLARRSRIEAASVSGAVAMIRSLVHRTITPFASVT